MVFQERRVKELPPVPNPIGVLQRCLVLNQSPELLPTRMHNALDAIRPVERQEETSQANRHVASEVAARGLPS